MDSGLSIHDVYFFGFRCVLYLVVELRLCRTAELPLLLFFLDDCACFSLQ